MSVVREHTQEIDGITYTCRTFPASEAVKILPRLIALFGARVVQIAMQAGPDQLEHYMAQPEILAAIVTEAAKAGAEDPEGWIVLKDLMANVTADKIRIGTSEVPGSASTHCDVHLPGRLMRLVKVAVWVATKSFSVPSCVARWASGTHTASRIRHTGASALQTYTGRSTEPAVTQTAR